MHQYGNLSPSKWANIGHMVFIPKGCCRALCAQLRQHLGEFFRRLAEQQKRRAEEGHWMVDHISQMVFDPAVLHHPECGIGY